MSITDRTDRQLLDSGPDSGAEGIEDVYELTPLQQGMLLHSLYGGDSDTYVAQNTFEIDGPIDIDTMLVAWQKTVAAHPSLRSSYHWEGLDKPLQVVHRACDIPVYQHDWSRLDAEQQRIRFDRLVTEDRQAGFFSLAEPPLQRLHLMRLGPDRHGCIWTHHMLPMDAWSEMIVMNDVMAWYRHLALGEAAPEQSVAYREYIAWLQRQDLDAARDFWSASLGGDTGTGRVMSLRPPPRQEQTGPIAVHDALLPTALAQGLRSAAARHRVTFSTLVEAAWSLVLQRHNGESAVTFGCTSSGRPADLPGIDRIVGSFINSLPVKVAVPDDADLGEWLRDVQRQASAVRRYEYSPLSQIKVWAGTPGPQPLFSSLVVLNNFPSEITLGSVEQQLTFRLLNAFEKTSEPLTVKVYPEPEPNVRLVVHRDRFDPAAVEGIMADFQSALAGLVDADRVAAAATRLAPVPTSTVPPVDYPDAAATLMDLVERQAAQTPDAVAVRGDQGTLSYADLMARSRAVAAVLVEAGAGPGRVVAVCADRSPEMVVAIMGTLLAGAAYLPLDPTMPVARLRYVVEEADAVAVLAAGGGVDAARETAPDRVQVLTDLPTTAAAIAPSGVGGSDAAYVIYTSGSTGQPKGVVVTHRAIVNRLLWMQDTFGLTPADRVLQKTPFGFDVSVWELFWPLLVGASIVLARPGGHQDSDYLAATLAEQQISTVHFVPSMLQLFLEESTTPDLPQLRRVLCSGEELPLGLVERFRAAFPQVELHNLYGPTEAAVDVTWWDCAKPGPVGIVPIGYPVANTEAYVLDRRLRVTPVDVPGELYLGGVQLAQGYLGRPGLTAARFVAHPFGPPGARLYRTGDRARRHADGSLEFLGRVDRQVKLRGYRIELGEIEQVMAGWSGVREAAVVVVDGSTGPRLAAYVTGIEESAAEELRDHVRSRLPGYMVPATVTVLPALPLTRNGKLDRAALPAPVVAAPTDPEALVPATPDEERVAAAYREVLGLEQLDLTMSFFDLGGDSFAAVRAVRRIEGATVAQLATHQSVRELAAALSAPRAGGGLLVPLHRPPGSALTMVCVPFGGGSSITYRPLAGAVGPQLTLLAASLPGHELGGDPELRPLREVAAAIVAQVVAEVEGPLVVYGHCVGTAMAVELTRLLEQAGRPAERLFIGAAYPFYEPRLIERTFLRRSVDVSDEEEIAYMKSLGGFSGTIGDEELAFVMLAFRHDLNQGRRYFSEQWPRRRAFAPMRTPITFIAGTADPETVDYLTQFTVWERFSPAVELAEIPDGGHYFMQHNPVELGAVLRHSLHLPEPPVHG